jgi:hypothetical protein
MQFQSFFMLMTGQTLGFCLVVTKARVKVLTFMYQAAPGEPISISLPM